MKEKIGIGLVSYMRPEMFRKCLDSIPLDKGYEIVICNDTPGGYPGFEYPKGVKVIQNEVNLGVGKSKNACLRWLLERGATDLFLCEDDIIVKDHSVFEKYIEARKVTGIQHFSFFGHGPASRLPNGKPNPRLIVNYTPEIGIAFYPNCIGAFCYYTADVLEKVGLMDEFYINNCEHLQHTYEIAKAGFTSPWWFFADLNESWKYLEEIESSETSSVIRPRADWQSNIKLGWNYFKQKFGCYPTEIPDTRQEDVIGFLKKIRP
jgi:GT2 family glycosyltransferase